jgi:hypothetical protein
MATTEEAPTNLDLARDRDLHGRAWQIWVRRGLLVVLLAIVVLALLNVFGQKPASSRVDSPQASLDLYTPSRVRGGLMFESRFTIFAHQDLKTPKLVLDPGWFEQMTINSLEPQPSTETSRNGKMVLTFDSLQAGQKLVFWAFFQVNPTNVGHRPTGVELDDGNTPLLHIKRTVTIFP